MNSGEEGKIRKLRDYSCREFYDGVACGVAAFSLIAGFVDIEDGKMNHPYLIGIPAVSALCLGLYNQFKHGPDKGCSDLEKELKDDLYSDSYLG